MAIEMETYEKIRFLKEQKGLSQRAIAQQLQISRNTVKRYCKGENVPWERKSGSGRKASIITDEVIQFIQMCIDEDELQGLKKQQHTAKRIYERLVSECGFNGGESTVRNIVADMKNKPKQAFVPLSFSPAEAIQVDWGEATVYLKNVKTKLNIWCMRECFSGKIYLKAFFRQNEESFLEGLQDGFEYYGGVPRKIIFDNARVAVKEGFGYHAKCTDKYKAFSSHYAFLPIFCNAAQGHEKGLVEGLVGFSRRNFLVPVPKIENIEELNEILEQKIRQYDNHQIKGKPDIVGKMAEQCSNCWIPLPAYRFDTARKLIVKVNEFSLVSFDHNKYSVPFRYVGKNVTVSGFGNNIRICFENHVIAEYVRRYEWNKTEYRLEHYIDLIERRPRSAFNAAPVKAVLPEKVMQVVQKQQSPKTIIRLLRLYLEFGDRLTDLCSGTINVEQIEAELFQAEPKCLTVKKDITVNNVALKQYDNLMKEGTV